MEDQRRATVVNASKCLINEEIDHLFFIQVKIFDIPTQASVVDLRRTAGNRTDDHVRGFKLHTCIDFVFSCEQVGFDSINILLSLFLLFHSFVNTQFVIDHFISPINRDQNNYNDVSRDSTGVSSHFSRRDASSHLRRTCWNNDIFIR
jgi:hypothetical protein